MSADPAVAGDVRYEVVALSIQADGAQWMVGDAEQGDFYQFPAEGVHVLRLLQQGQGVAAIKAACRRELDEPIDVDSFIEQLLQIGFIYPSAQPRSRAMPATAAAADRRLQFSISRHAAQRFFAVPALLLYASIVAAAMFLMTADPALRPDLGALFFADHLSITLVLLLLLYSGTAMLHELGHLIAAARRGVATKLGVGNRLWMIVAEADLTNIYSLPKSQRYLPLVAGMAVDCLSICGLTLLTAALGHFAASAYLIHLLQALILQVLISISWQFNFFLKTDVYYLLCTYYGYPDLDREARHYVRSLLHRYSGGLVASPPEPCQYYRLRVLQYFTLAWILGRILALVFLAAILIPTLASYGAVFYRAATGAGALSYNTWDLGIFVLLSSALFGFGAYLWLFRRARF